ncbi:hypothetical protein [Raineyella sp. LH-20]|uniref:hypothetical protein n=1 Tax=Raineyella sp. LH-20 TaxID=3081204 RepID=UPI00295503EB|nr:hypothetical protein [Raineyella sp. LH-20]WOP19361.1 hypothetical protein R0146_03550 [Raineyella sp. LH-20]
MASRRVCGLMVAWVVVGAAGLLAGCGGGPGVAPIPTPSYSCSPDPAGTPCTAELAAAQAEEAKAYEEAIFAYQEFTKERNRLLHAGGSPVSTPTMERYATGPYLEAMAGDLKLVYDNDLKSTGDIEVRGYGLEKYEPERLELYLCEDATAVRLIRADGRQASSGLKGKLRVVAAGPAGERRIEDTVQEGESECP